MIHTTAIIHPNAKIAENVEIGAYSVIGADVEIGEGCWIGPHVVIKGPTKIGKANKIFQFASIGEDPQDKKYKDERTFLEIGDRNTFRECVTIHRGTIQDQLLTKVGNDNLFMAYVHVAHDCVIGNGCIFANSVAIAGHVKIADFVIMSGMCGVHQFCQIGAYSFISNASIILKDIPPYVMITGGVSPTVCGLNVEGLKRHGFSPASLQSLRKAYKIIYRQGLRVVEAIEGLREMEAECAEIKILADFLETSERGIIR
ncbi:MAG: acyl-ACP--UDP-N-acetylglucosamine O-acyltransferase [Gammaproteobacteria bacterium]|nr:acyl-ACP--UDP-N-acetylglucosamine O-acyltransferase [Gammaproteobacteria bacterium]